MRRLDVEAILEKTMVIASDLEAARQVEQLVLSEVVRHGYSEASVFSIRLALEEGLNNAIKHGNHYDPLKKVEVCYEVDRRHVEIRIRDEGEGFNPTCVPDPTCDENLERPCGRGIMLMRAYMDEVGYNEAGNEIRLIKHNA